VSQLFNQYLRFNLTLLPLYLLLGIGFFIGFMLTAEKDTFFNSMSLAILQAWILLTIPNIIYAIVKRKEEGNLKGLFSIFFFIPVPFVILVGLLGFLLFMDILPK
jgi:hypothetical protein